VALSEYSISVDDGEEYVEMKLAYIDADSDIAIVVPKKNLTSIEPKRWRVNKSKNLVGETLKYVGYPSGLGKLLIRGMASADRVEALIMQSFALPGSSGSVVFDSKGRVVGIISAVMMNQSPFSPYPNMEENIVFVPRVDFMNKTFIKEVLRCAGK
jgi:V8-like Glu-specific endopeptidase